MSAEPAARDFPSWPSLGRGRIGRGEVRKVEAETRTFRAMDYRYGGGWCREAVSAQLSWGYRLLDAGCSDVVHAQLCVALADLTNLAGWTAFDSGEYGQALARFDRALALAEEGGDDSLASNILYRKGRVYLQQEALPQALSTFELGLRTAESAGSWLMRSVLYANEAWAYAKLRDTRMALTTLDRARDAFDRADPDEADVWVKFFGETDLAAMSGTVHTELAVRVDPTQAAAAVADLIGVVRAYGCSMARSRSFCLAMLATGHLLEGDFDHAAQVTREALALAGSLSSARFVTRLQPLRREAARRHRNAHAREIAESVSAFVAA